MAGRERTRTLEQELKRLQARAYQDKARARELTAQVNEAGLAEEARSEWEEYTSAVGDAYVSVGQLLKALAAAQTPASANEGNPAESDGADEVAAPAQMELSTSWEVSEPVVTGHAPI